MGVSSSNNYDFVKFWNEETQNTLYNFFDEEDCNINKDQYVPGNIRSGCRDRKKGFG